MKVFSISLLFVLPILLMACTNNPEVKDDDAKAKQALVGVWRGEGTYEEDVDSGWAESWKMVRDADGRYAVEYLIVHDGEKLYELSSDAGTWSYEGGTYYEVNRNGDKTNYTVYSVKEDGFEYNIVEREGSANIQETKTVDTYQLQAPPKGYSEVTYDQPAEDQSAEDQSIE